MEGGDPERGTKARWAKLNTCLGLLCVVCAMSAWWYALFWKMGYGLLTKSVKETAQEEYEGNSDEDSDDEAIATRETPKVDAKAVRKSARKRATGNKASTD